MRTIYLILSLLGLILPLICFTQHFLLRGDAAWPEFFAAPFETWVIAGFSSDLLITATTCSVWMVSESRRLKMPGIGWHIVLIFAVGICFALPTFLYRREPYVAQRP